MIAHARASPRPRPPRAPTFAVRPVAGARLPARAPENVLARVSKEALKGARTAATSAATRWRIEASRLKEGIDLEVVKGLSAVGASSTLAPVRQAKRCGSGGARGRGDVVDRARERAGSQNVPLLGRGPTFLADATAGRAARRCDR